MGYYKGIDVSDNQGIIDWAKVKQAGVDFAILRSTRGSGKADNYLASNIKGCIDHGIPFDFYKYQYALSEKESANEAKRVVEALKALGVVPSKDVIIWDDIEYDKQLALGKTKVTGIINAFMYEILAAGFGYGLYMGKYDYETKVESEKFTVPLWIARYYKGYTPVKFGEIPDEKYRPQVVKGSTSEIWGWQHSSAGQVPGIKGPVDLNVCYQEIREVEVKPEYFDTPEFTLIESLNKIGVDSTVNNRKIIAARNGIQGYIGSVEQNLQMLQLLNSGKLLK